MSARRKFLRFAAIYLVGMLFTYGHAYKEIKAEDAQLDFPGFAAWGDSLFWPCHWSAFLWSIV